MPIVDVKPFFPRLGRISAGYMVARKKDGRVVTFPTKSETFVFSSDDRARLEVVARTFGGKVESSPDPEAEGRFRVVTQARELEVFLPTGDERGWDSWWEMWGASGCLRRCNGERCLFAINPETGEFRTDIECICKAMGLRRTDPAHCKPVSRLNVIIPALKDAPGLGVWQVTSRGLSTYNSVQAAIDLARRFGDITGVPMVLRIVMNKTINKLTGELRTFPTIVLSTRESYAEAFRRRVELGIPPEMLPLPDRDTKPLGAGLTPEQEEASREAELEQVAYAAQPAPDPEEAEAEPTEFGEEAAVEAAAGEEVEPIVPEPEPESEEQEEIAAREETAPRAGTRAAATTQVSPPPGQGVPSPTMPASGGKRDYTTWWATIRQAARVEGDEPEQWLARITEGKTDPREMSDDMFNGVFFIARNVVSGRARTKDRPEQAAPPRAASQKRPQGGVAHVPDGSGRATTEQIQMIVKIWRELKVPSPAQAEQVREVSGGRTILLTHLTQSEADELIRRLHASITA